MIAAPQHGPFQVAELVEQKEWVIAGSLEVSMVHCALLLAVGFADGAIEVEDPLFGRLFLFASWYGQWFFLCRDVDVGNSSEVGSQGTRDRMLGAELLGLR